jgi:hypothetical protein
MKIIILLNFVLSLLQIKNFSAAFQKFKFWKFQSHNMKASTEVKKVNIAVTSLPPCLARKHKTRVKVLGRYYETFYGRNLRIFVIN